MVKKRLLQGMVIVCLLLGFTAQPMHAMVTEADRAFMPLAQDGTDDLEWEFNQEIPDSYKLLAENEKFELHVDAASLAFKVVDKRSGYIWHSTLDDVEEERLNRTWTAFSTSGISIDYLDKKAISERASITNTNQTIDFQPVDQGFEASVTFTDASITLLVRVILNANGVSVEVPFDSITEADPDFKLGLLYVYPFFGATKLGSIPGYMFIPDGSGSLVRFADETKASNMFYGRYYGDDLGMITMMPYDPTINRAFKLSIPVSGMVHGEKQNGYIAVVEKGAGYGELHVHPAGVTTDFNFLYNAFIYNQSYFQATNRSGAGVTTLQQQTNQFDVKVNYRFLTGDESDYVGMAQSYQQYLTDLGRLNKVTRDDANIGIRLEFLGGEKEKILLWNRVIPMTTVTQMGEILNGLQVKNPEVIYYGWQPYGASAMPPTGLKVDRNLGNMDQVRSVIEQVEANNGNFYLYLDPQAALRDERGYSPRYDLAMSITNSNLIGFNRDKVNYYLNMAALSERYTALSTDVFSELNTGLALDGIGSNLYNDFKRGNFLNREQAIQNYRELLAASKGKVAFYRPNDYFYDLMNAYYDIPMSSSGYIYTTDVVPFLQIVLAGNVPYYGSGLNFSSNIEDDLLRHADYGTYPSFFLTNEATAKMINTRSSWIYTSSAGQWSEEVNRSYAWLNNLLGPVAGQEIVAREVLEDGVTATTYSNGKRIIVNYKTSPYSAGSLVVDGKDAVITEVNP